MERHHIARLYWGIIFTVAIITILQFFTAYQPVTFVAQNVQNLGGVSVNYNIPSTITPFYYSSLDVVNAPTITCTLSTAFYGTTTTNQIVPLSVQTTQASPFRQSFDLTGGVGQSFSTFSVQEQMTCPVKVTSFPPNLASGTTTLIWTATKQDGTTVSILNDQENIQPTVNGQAVSLPSGSTPLSGVTLYTWTVSKSQIENAIGVGAFGANFDSLQNISVSNTITFYQGNAVTIPWTFTNAGPTMISYTLHETSANPLAVNNAPMTLQVISPANKQVNLQTSQVVTVQGTISGWVPSQGQPDLRVLYVNPSGSGNGVIGDFYLQPDVPNMYPSATPTSPQTFTFKYAFPTTSGTGQYIFGLHFAGNSNVPQDSVYIVNTPVSCHTGQYFDGSTNACKTIATTNCGNGIIVTSGQQCPAPPQTVPTPPAPQPQPTCPVNLAACVTGINWSSILGSGQQAIGLAFTLLGFLLLLAIGSAVWHGYHKKQENEEMLIPSPVEMVQA